MFVKQSLKLTIDEIRQVCMENQILYFYNKKLNRIKNLSFEQFLLATDVFFFFNTLSASSCTLKKKWFSDLLN